MSIPMERLGDRAFHHSVNDDAEREYDRLRDLARSEAEKRNSCFDRSKRAYNNGDGAEAKELSNQGKAHDRKMDDYNLQASQLIFRENNAPGRVEADQIDLHGQFVEEAERILRQRIGEDRARGQHHLHVIVGKGNHSAGHVQKLKPKVEDMCRELGLNYRTEENEGRIFINLQGGSASETGGYGHQDGYQGGHQPQQQHHQQQQGHHQQQQQQHHQQQQQNNEDDDLVGKLLPKIFKAMEKHCCVMM
ncbi:unnamed protein product [Clonostachys rosea]|uniref:Smr domain-containing protein n=1 Tax=Bionectria ochroleuca TaxID=29856 RepID=A0ABY6UTX0_BIOOC|nr:unnamed protein product [Clonostachys rosea]